MALSATVPARFEKVRPLALRIAEETQSVCASCQGGTFFRRLLLQDKPFLASSLASKFGSSTWILVIVEDAGSGMGIDPVAQGEAKLKCDRATS
jgi:hypothetical protein